MCVCVCVGVCILVSQSCPTLCNPMRPRLLCPWNSPGKNTGVGCHSQLQGIFPTQGPNPGLLHCRWILYYLRHQESPRSRADSLFLLQWTFPTQESNWGLLHCRQILYQLSYLRSPLMTVLPVYPTLLWSQAN